MENNTQQINAVNLTRAGLVVSGVLGIVITAFVLLPSMGHFAAYAILNFQHGAMAPLFAASLAPFVMLALCWYVISKSHEIALSLFPNEVVKPSQTERAIYRVAFVTLGILILATTFPDFVNAIGYVFIEHAESSNWHYRWFDKFTMVNLPLILAFVFQLALAIYLILGAPYLVNWQIARNTENDE